jgi:hypothetical protein
MRWLDALLLNDGIGVGKIHLHVTNQPQPSEGQHTTDLYEMEDQDACRGEEYFFAAVVQSSPHSRSARSARQRFRRAPAQTRLLGQKERREESPETPAFSGALHGPLLCYAPSKANGGQLKRMMCRALWCVIFPTPATGVDQFVQPYSPGNQPRANSIAIHSRTLTSAVSLTFAI